MPKLPLCIFILLFSTSLLAQEVFSDSLIQHCFDIRYEDAEQATKDCELGIQLAQAANKDSIEARGTIILGLVKKGEGKYQEAIKLYEDCIVIRERLKDTSGVASAFTNIGAANEELGEYDKSIEANLFALNLVRQIEDKSRLGIILNNLSNSYAQTGKPQKAIEFINEAIPFFTQQENLWELGNCHLNLGTRQLESGNYAKAKSSYFKALEYYKIDGDEEGLGNTHNALGVLYMDQSQMDSARYYYAEAARLLEIWQDDKVGWSGVYLNLAQLERKYKNLKKSKAHLLTAQQILGDRGGLFDQWYLHNALAETFSQVGQYDSAYHYQVTAQALNDSMFNIEKASTIAKLQTEYEVKIKDQEYEILNERAAKTTNQRNTFITVSSLLALLAIFIIYFFQQRAKAKNLLAKKNEELHQKQVEELLRSQEVKVYQSQLEAQETERKRLAVELHDRVGGTLAGLKWQFEALAEGQQGKEKELDKTQNLLDQTYREVREISHSMAGGSSTRFGLEKAAEDLINAAQRPGKLDAQLITFGLEQAIDGNIEIEAYRLLQELISNVLKHSNAQHLNVQIEVIDQQLNITVEDDGIGFNPEKAAAGLGLKSIDNRIENLKGALNIDSGRGGGTTVMIEIPLA